MQQTLLCQNDGLVLQHILVVRTGISYYFQIVDFVWYCNTTCLLHTNITGVYDTGFDDGESKHICNIQMDGVF